MLILNSTDHQDIHFLSSLLKILKPSGRIIIALSKEFEKISENLKLAGYVNISVKENGNIY